MKTLYNPVSMFEVFVGHRSRSNRFYGFAYNHMFVGIVWAD